ncbi:MAG: DUF1499 domain-containing protein [Candidatus Tectomicrobia bacterium]
MHNILQNALFVLLAVVVVVVLVIVLIGREQLLVLVFGPVELSRIDFTTLTRTTRPNQYLVCPPDVCAQKPDAVSPVYEVPATTLRDWWLAMIAQQPRVQQVGVSQDGWQYDLLQRSRLMRFPDSITVRFMPRGDATSTLAIYSHSHYGRSDFGVNRKRVEAWLKALPMHRFNTSESR